MPVTASWSRGREEKMCGPIRSREITDIRLLDELCVTKKLFQDVALY